MAEPIDDGSEGPSTQIVVYPWLLWFPAAAMAATILALYALADAITDTRAPRRTTPAT